MKAVSEIAFVEDDLTAGERAASGGGEQTGSIRRTQRVQ
jgi:hypothetical protein